MVRLSLRLRSFIAALLALVLFIPFILFSLKQAFTYSLTESMHTQLRILSWSLISEFELEDTRPNMPEQLFNEQLNLPGSGLYAFIQMQEQIIWQSLSTLDWQNQLTGFSAPAVGDEHFSQHDNNHQAYFSVFLYR